MPKEIVLKSNFGPISFEKIVEAFKEEGFSVTKFVQDSSFDITYKGLTSTVRATFCNPVNGTIYRSISMKPNKRYVTTNIRDIDGVPHSVISIDFESFQKELDYAALAKDKREGNKKAVKFQSQMYLLYLQNIMVQLGAEVSNISLVDVSEKCVIYNVNLNPRRNKWDCRLPIPDFDFTLRINTLSNKSMEAFTEGEFKDIIGSIFFSKHIKDVNVEDYLLNVLGPTITKYMEAAERVPSVEKGESELMETLKKNKALADKQFSDDRRSLYSTLNFPDMKAFINTL